MPNPDPARAPHRPRAGPCRGRRWLARLLLAVLTPGPLLAMLAAVTASDPLAHAAAAVSAHAVLAGTVLTGALAVAPTRPVGVDRSGGASDPA